MSKERSDNTKAVALSQCALFAALTGLLSQISVPLPFGVPINLAMLAVFVAGAMLGPKRGGICMCVYLAVGAVGVPVFSGFTGGMGILLGKTGGYLIGYLLCAILVGFAAQRWGSSFWRLCVSMSMGLVLCYLFGTLWFMVVTGIGFFASLTYCVIPFLVGDALKIGFGAWLVTRLGTRLERK